MNDCCKKYYSKDVNSGQARIAWAFGIITPAYCPECGSEIKTKFQDEVRKKTDL